MPKDPEVTRTSLEIARAVQRRDRAAETEARRQHAAARLESYVARVVAEAPPLSPEQAERIAALLRPTADRAAAGRAVA